MDLFADDPVVFKKLVEEMRFDEASAPYGLFGPFYMGLQLQAEELGALLEGRTPGSEWSLPRRSFVLKGHPWAVGRVGLRFAN